MQTILLDTEALDSTSRQTGSVGPYGKYKYTLL